MLVNGAGFQTETLPDGGGFQTETLPLWLAPCASFYGIEGDGSHANRRLDLM
ncbi:MAG: hypothetical protein JWM33_1786 [Caulobacteraceae bacterium]|nr:hypothetical protein [Caulobacteraceae bacterium]